SRLVHSSPTASSAGVPARVGCPFLSLSELIQSARDVAAANPGELSSRASDSGVFGATTTRLGNLSGESQLMSITIRPSSTPTPRPAKRNRPSRDLRPPGFLGSGGARGCHDRRVVEPDDGGREPE